MSYRLIAGALVCSICLPHHLAPALDWVQARMVLGTNPDPTPPWQPPRCRVIGNPRYCVYSGPCRAERLAARGTGCLWVHLDGHPDRDVVTLRDTHEIAFWRRRLW